MKIWAIRLLFAITIIWWAAGLNMLTQGRREPYPAIAMPGFTGTGGADSTHVSTRLAEIVFHYADGHLVNLTPKTFLADVPDSNVGRVINRNFDPNVVMSRFGPNARRDERGKIVDIDKPLDEWLSALGRTHYTAAPPTDLVINWTMFRRDLANLSAAADITPVGTHTFVLGKGI